MESNRIRFLDIQFNNESDEEEYNPNDEESMDEEKDLNEYYKNTDDLISDYDSSSDDETFNNINQLNTMDYQNNEVNTQTNKNSKKKRSYLRNSYYILNILGNMVALISIFIITSWYIQENYIPLYANINNNTNDTVEIKEINIGTNPIIYERMVQCKQSIYDQVNQKTINKPVGITIVENCQDLFQLNLSMIHKDMLPEYYTILGDIKSIMKDEMTSLNYYNVAQEILEKKDKDYKKKYFFIEARKIIGRWIQLRQLHQQNELKLSCENWLKENKRNKPNEIESDIEPNKILNMIYNITETLVNDPSNKLSLYNSYKIILLSSFDDVSDIEKVKIDI